MSVLRKFLVGILSLCLLCACGNNTGNFSNPKENAGYVDPTIGNVAWLMVPTYPTFQLPAQMLRMIPDKKNYIEDQINGFPLQVVGHRKSKTLPFKIVTGDLKPASWNHKMSMDHDLEIVRPWHYSTYLIDDDIRISFTPSAKSGIFKLEFQEDTQKHLLFSGSKAMETYVDQSGSFFLKDQVVDKGEGIDSLVKTMDIFIYAEFTGSDGRKYTDIQHNSKSRRSSISLPASSPGEIYLKYSVSYIDSEQARQNFQNEIADVTFTTVMDRAKSAWDAVLDQIEVEGGTEAQKRVFYTALYRNYERMVNINEYGRYYSGYSGEVHTSERPFYVDDWIWDTYRTTHPLKTILDPEMQNDILNSFTLMYEQSGLMPTFAQAYGNHMCMNSYHSSSIFLDGYRKGLQDFDIEKAYEGIRKNLFECTFIPWRQGIARQDIDDFYHEHGFYPALRSGEEETIALVDHFEKRQPVAVSLGIAYDMWTLSELARDLGKKDDISLLAPYPDNYKILWHPEHQLFMPKDENGEWIEIDPKWDGGQGFREYYDENNGWTYAWDVQHDIQGLAELLGGKKAAEERLDQLFREPLDMRLSEFYQRGRNSTGMVGQFSMGNEPSFHIPYLYNYFGAPWKTQKRTRFLLDLWFMDNVFGIPGDEDGGAMSAFAVFTALGLYPVTPGIPTYSITSPVFEKATIHLKNGKKFTIIAEGASRRNKYIHKAFIDGEEIFTPFISHDQIMEGATLELVLGELPDKRWGTE